MTGGHRPENTLNDASIKSRALSYTRRPRLLAPLNYLAFRGILALVLLGCRSREFKELEIVVLRHELAILRRQVGRPAFRSADRAFLAAAGRFLPRTRWSSFVVTPDTLLRWTYPSRSPG